MLVVEKSSTQGTKRVAVSPGQSQWGRIWKEFRKRRLALMAAAVILFLVTVSICAPFLANATPITYYGVNRFEFQEANRSLRGTLTQLLNQKSEPTPAEIGRTAKSIALQIQLMSNAIEGDKKTELAALGQKLVGIVRSPGLSSKADELRQIQKDLRSSFDSKEVKLIPKRHWPVAASLNGLDIFFLVAIGHFLLLPIWRRLISSISSTDRSRFWLSVSTQFAVPVIAGLLWWWAVPFRIDRTDYKAGVMVADPAAATASVVYDSVVWPPIVYSLDEYDLGDKSSAPVWYPTAWIPPKHESTPSKPGAESTAKKSQWSGPHWLGTDEAGRDVMCRMIWGGRVSLSVGLVAVAIYVSIGIVVGAVAGYFRGICDLVISRIIEVIICFPTFFLILTIVSFFGPSIINIMVIIGLTGWTGIARLVRGEFLRLVDQEFVLAGRALGYSPTRLIFRHVLPNAMAPVLVSATFGIAGAILTESALSFLGLGISKPTPSWGGLLADGREALLHAPWLIHFPGFAIFITITAYNLMGEALRDASDPRLRGSR